MRKAKTFLAATVLAMAAVPFAAAPANAVVCHEDPHSCCGDVTVLGKTIFSYNC